jgi:hypothetical protein
MNANRIARDDSFDRDDRDETEPLYEDLAVTAEHAPISGLDPDPRALIDTARRVVTAASGIADSRPELPFTD